MSTQDPSFHDRPDPDRTGGYGSDPYGGGQAPPPGYGSGQAPPPGYGGGQPYGGQPRNGLGTAALVCGVIAVALSLIPGFNLFTWPVGVLAIVFGAVGWNRVNKGQATNKGQTITGLILGIASFFTFCLIYMLIGAGSEQISGIGPF